MSRQNGNFARNFTKQLQETNIDLWNIYQGKGTINSSKNSNTWRTSSCRVSGKPLPRHVTRET